MPFRFGQKVWCWWYNSCLIKAPKCAIILFRLPYKGSYYPYVSKEWFYLVKVKGGFLAAVPEGCIRDIEEEIKEHEKHASGPQADPEQESARQTLIKWQNERIKFLNNQ